MGAVQNFLTAVRDALKKSPLMTNVFLSLALVAFEKITEAEFICPCSPRGNAVFSTVFSLLPFVLVFLLMMVTREWEECGKCGKRIKLVLCEKCEECRKRRINWSQCLKNFCISLIPAVVWLILVFMDGQYFACFMTSWSGRFVILEGAGTKKWCKPDDSKLNEEDYKIKIHSWFFTSQLIGVVIAAVLTLALGGYAISLCRKPPTDNMLIQTKFNKHQRYVKIKKPSRDEYLDSAFKVFSTEHDKKKVKVFNGTGTEVDAEVFEEVVQQSSAGVFTIRFDNETQGTAQPSCSPESASSATPLLGDTNNSSSAPREIENVEMSTL